jgi:hypothetical protein
MHYFDKNGLGFILGDVFTNTSGHPEGELDDMGTKVKGHTGSLIELIFG